MKPDEFSPLDYINRTIGLWWIVALTTLLGGAFGFLFYHLHPPIYEATATFIVSIDLNRFPIQGVREDLIQYNEDMALNTTQDALLSLPVRNDVITQLHSVGLSLTDYDLLKNNTIERKQDVWELRYRSENPITAQTVVNTWAKIGYQAMLSWQATGKAPAYVIFQPPTESLIPEEPVYYKRNNLMLAGSLFGFTLGIIITSLVSQIAYKSQSPHAG